MFKYLPLALSLLLFPLSATAQMPSLKVVVSGAEVATGVMEVSLFNSAEDFLVEPLNQQSGEINEDGQFVAEFFGLVEGDYAVVVVHDENDNGMLDTGFLGFGGESIGYSNDARPLLGRPSFDDAKIQVTEHGQQIEISLD